MTRPNRPPSLGNRVNRRIPWVRFSIVLVLGLFVTLIGSFPAPVDEKGELVMSGRRGRFLTCRGMGCRPW